MSAFQVSSEHIGAIVRFWVESNRRTGYARFRNNQLNDNDAPEVMRVLAQECYNSVHARYPSGPLPGPISAGDGPVTPDQPLSHYRTLTPVEAIKACHCYTYQSCEHDGWPTSEAHGIIEDIINTAVHKLAGYSEAPWHIDESRAEQKARESAARREHSNAMMAQSGGR